MSNGNPTTTTSAAPSHNVWDAVIAAFVLAALVFLTLSLVDHKGYTSKDVTSILGVVTPLLAVIVGGAIGAAAGHAAGKAKGEQDGKQKVLDKIKPVVSDLRAHTEARAETVDRANVSASVARLHGMIEALD